MVAIRIRTGRQSDGSWFGRVSLGGQFKTETVGGNRVAALRRAIDEALRYEPDVIEFVDEDFRRV